MSILRHSMILGVAAGLLALGAPATAEVLTFDDVGTNAFTTLPSSYHGFTLDYWASVNAFNYGPSGYANGVVSGGNSACACASDSGHAFESISNAGGLTLTSGYFTSAWNDGATLTVTGLSGATTLFTTTAVLDTTGPSFLTFDWSGIDSVQFSIAGGTPHPGLLGAGDYFAVDNLSITANSVPEPASWAMMIGGFGLVGAAMRRRAVALA